MFDPIFMLCTTFMNCVLYRLLEVSTSRFISNWSYVLVVWNPSIIEYSLCQI